MEFNGWRESDKGGIFGQWKGTQGNGSFAVYPSKDTEAAKKMNEETKKSNKKHLLSMGFPDWLVDQAMVETEGLEPAITFITKQLGESRSLEKDSGVSDADLQQLISMGFDDEMAKQALKATKSVEEAANWLFDRM